MAVYYFFHLNGIDTVNILQTKLRNGHEDSSISFRVFSADKH